MGMMKRIRLKLDNEQDLTPEEEALCDTYRESPDDPGNRGVAVSIPTTRDIEKHETDRCFAEQGLREAVSNLLNLGDQPEVILSQVSQLLAEKDPTFAVNLLAEAACLIAKETL